MPEDQSTELAVPSRQERQEAALEMLISGKSVAETARIAGVGRGTVFRWLRDDPHFRAAYNQWQEEVKEHTRGRLLALTDKAAGALEKALEAGDARSALQLLQGLGLIQAQKPQITDARELAQRSLLEEKKRKNKLAEDQRGVDIQDELSRWADEEICALVRAVCDFL